MLHKVLRLRDEHLLDQVRPADEENAVPEDAKWDDVPVLAGEPRIKPEPVPAELGQVAGDPPPRGAGEIRRCPPPLPVDQTRWVEINGS